MISRRATLILGVGVSRRERFSCAVGIKSGGLFSECSFSVGAHHFESIMCPASKRKFATGATRDGLSRRANILMAWAACTPDPRDPATRYQ